MKVKIDIDVVNGIINSYTRRSANQTRVYGIIFGTSDKDTYHVTNALYGYIFEEGKENDKIKFNRLNNESVNSLLSSYSTHFSNEAILGGFATDKEPIPELNNLFSTINLISSKMYHNKNSLVILVDAFHTDKNNISYGIKAYNWMVNYQIGKNQEDLSVMICKELPVIVVDKQIMPTIINTKGIDQWKVGLGINQADISNVEAIDSLVDSLMKIDDMNVDSSEENISYMKMQLKLCDKYLDVIGKYLKDIDMEHLDNNLLNKISLIIALLKPLFEKDEIVKLMQKDSKQNEIVLSMANLLNIQVQLTEKINKNNV